MQNSVYSKLKQQMYDFKTKNQSWDFGNNYTINNNWAGEGDLVAAGYSWPPRSYTCTFCKREFRSAQALGGHMNVHRRDRARLRQSPPPQPQPPLDGFAAAGCNNGCSSGQFSLLNINPNPNLGINPNSGPTFVPCNSNPTLSSLLTKFPRFAAALPPCDKNGGPGRDGNGPVTKDLIQMKGSKGADKFGSTGFGSKGSSCGVFKKGELVRLDLEIGLISETKEELDLELRLGQN